MSGADDGHRSRDGLPTDEAGSAPDPRSVARGALLAVLLCKPLTMADFADCFGPMQGEVGYTGDIEELREYPCNCPYCRGDR